MTRRRLEHLVMAAGVVAVVLAAVLANARTRLFYERAEVRRSEVLGRPLSSQDALAEVVAVTAPVADAFEKPVRGNAGRGPANLRHQAVALRILTGINRGRLVLARNILQFDPAGSAFIARGSNVRVSMTMSEGSVYDVLIYKPIVRFPVIIYLVAALLCGGIVALRIRGLALAAALLLSVLGLSLLVFPLVLRGMPPLLAVSAYALLMTMVFLLLLEGWGRKGLAATIGACGGMAVAVAAVLIAVGPLKLSGYPTTFSIMLKEALPADHMLSFVSLLTAGTAVCVLGLVLDLGVSIAAAVEAVCRQAGGISSRAALAAGMRMNRDVMGTMLLTLVFVWLGESLHAMMLPDALYMSGRELLNNEAMAVELLGLAAGGIGLVATGPITALAAVSLFMHAKPQTTARRREENRLWPLWLVLSVELAICVACAVCIASTAGEADRGSPWEQHGVAAAVPKLTSSADLCQYAREQLSRGNEAQAALALWRAGTLDPRCGLRHRELARIYVNERWFVLAHDEIRQALDLLPNDSDTHYVAGVTWSWLSDEHRAESELKKALELDPKNTNASEALRTLFGADQP